MRVNMIWAESSNGFIGNHGQLPWDNIPEDLSHFRDLTTGCVVIMGRRTWESLPPKHRPLKGRFNIILTNDPQGSAYMNAMQCKGLPEALNLADTIVKQHNLSDVVWIIGGRQVFDQAFDSLYIDELHVTHLPFKAGGDVKAPPIPNYFDDGVSTTIDTHTGLLRFTVYTNTTTKAEDTEPLQATTQPTCPSPVTAESSLAALSFLFKLIKAEAELNGQPMSSESAVLSLTTSGASAVVTVRQMELALNTMTDFLESKNPMVFDPATGKAPAEPFTPSAYRRHHGQVAWLFNPWTGTPRNALDIGSDVFGHLIQKA